jgi:hypothetical protein
MGRQSRLPAAPTGCRRAFPGAEEAPALRHLDVDPDGHPLAFADDGRIVDVWREPTHG